MYGTALLTTLLETPRQSHAAAILRHAERFPITDPARPELAELKPSGVEASIDFGRRVTGFGRVRLYHSPVKRCQQTAEGILRGLAERGVKGEIAGPREELGVAYIRNTLEAGRLGGALGEEFIRHWFNRQVPPDIVRPPAEVGALHRDFIERMLRENAVQERCLDLHVTHDWNILALREWLLGVRHEEAGWIDFLDGLVFTPCAPAGVQALCPARPLSPARFAR